MLAWIVAYTHGAHRLRIPCDGGRNSRVVLQLPCIPWLEQLFKEHGVACEWVGHVGDGKPELCGLVELRPSLVWHGPTTLLTSQARVLHEYFRCPVDCVAMQVTRFAKLVSPIGIAAVAGRQSFYKPGILSTIVPVQGWAVQGVPARPVEQLLDDWGYEGS
jgi:hypothetical protein